MTGHLRQVQIDTVGARVPKDVTKDLEGKAFKVWLTVESHPWRNADRVLHLVPGGIVSAASTRSSLDRDIATGTLTHTDGFSFRYSVTFPLRCHFVFAWGTSRRPLMLLCRASGASWWGSKACDHRSDIRSGSSQGRKAVPTFGLEEFASFFVSKDQAVFCVNR